MVTYIENRTFIKDELIPLVETLISEYIDDDMRYVETSDELEEIEFMNCPDELRETIFNEVSNLINECIDDYDIISDINKEEYEDKIGAIIDEKFEEIKKEKIDIRREDFDRLDYFEDPEEEY